MLITTGNMGSVPSYSNSPCKKVIFQDLTPIHPLEQHPNINRLCRILIILIPKRYRFKHISSYFWFNGVGGERGGAPLHRPG
jgi:hypothetical protein